MIRLDAGWAVAGAVLACVPLPVNEVIARIDALQLALAEGDEIPDRPEDLVALLWTSQPPPALVDRLHELRTNLLLCGMALQPEDIIDITIDGIGTLSNPVVQGMSIQ